MILETPEECLGGTGRELGGKRLHHVQVRDGWTGADVGIIVENETRDSI